MPTTTTANIELVAPSEWDDVVRAFPNYTVFHTLAWLKTVADVHKAKPHLIQMCVDGECQAVWPILETRKSVFRIVGSPLPGCSTAYMGPLFTRHCDVPASINAFMSDERFRKCAFFACKVLNDLMGAPAVDLAPHGFEDVLRFETYCLDLELSSQELWDNLKGTCRTQIRKAQRMGIEIRQEHDDSFLEEYWTMSLETFANTNIQPTFPREFIDAMWNNLHPTGQLCALSAWHEGQRIAILMLPHDEHTMYYWGGATYDRLRTLPSHNLLHWKAIELAQQMGLRCYDFIATLGGAGRFKRTFGPKTVTSAVHWERTSSRLIKALKNRYEQYLTRRQVIKAMSVTTSLWQMTPEICGA